MAQQKVSIKWSGKEDELVFKYTDHITKYIGYHIAKVLQENKKTKDKGFIPWQALMSIKVKVTIDIDE